jgi:hypothetical protein
VALRDFFNIAPLLNSVWYRGGSQVKKYFALPFSDLRNYFFGQVREAHSFGAKSRREAREHCLLSILKFRKLASHKIALPHCHTYLLSQLEF